MLSTIEDKKKIRELEYCLVKRTRQSQHWRTKYRKLKEAKPEGKSNGSEANEESGSRVVDIIVGGVFKGIYANGAHYEHPRADRLVSIKGVRERYLAFGCGSPEEVDRPAEEVRFPLVKFCMREIVS